MKRGSKFILVLLSLTQLLVVIDSVIVNLALPAIKTALNFDAVSLQWVLTAYVLTFGGFLMLGGRASDLFGRRRVLVLGIAGFTLCSLLLGFTGSSSVLIVLRALEGLCAAFMSPAALSILLATWPEGDERNRALSIWSVVISGGAALGVILGGVLTQYAGWRWNFFINVPIGIFAIAGILKWVPSDIPGTQQRHVDLIGAVLVTGGLIAMVYGLMLASSSGWANPATLMSLALSLGMLVAFLYNETRAKHPLVPLSIFRSRSVSGGNLIMLLLIGACFGVGYFGSLYIQNVLRYSPAASGLAFLPIPVIIGVVSIQAPRLLGRFGFKSMLVVGMVCIGIGVLLLSFLQADSSYWTQILPPFAIFALGNGVAFVALTVAATSGVRDDETGLASGLINTSQQVGGALGLAILADVANTITSADRAVGQSLIQANLHGYQQAFLLAAVMLALAVLVAAFVLRTAEPVSASPCVESQALGMEC